MFTVNTSKGNFKVGFKHFNNEGDSVRYTECSLFIANDKNEKDIVLSEFAYCNPEDNFDRAVGRELSLERMLKLAIKLIGFTNEDWKNIWSEYNKIHKRVSKNIIKSFSNDFEFVKFNNVYNVVNQSNIDKELIEKIVDDRIKKLLNQ